MDELRQTGQRIAESYDALPYETPDDPGLWPRALLGFGGAFGCAGAMEDVLDLGCGTGVQLAAAAQQMSGSVTGVDLSRANCRRAGERLAPFGARVRIHHADLLDLDAAALGRFDLIYAVGLVFAVPPAVRAHVLTLIAACLKPGGVALISHYGGMMPEARNWVHRLIRAEIAPGLAPADAAAKARQALLRLLPRLEAAPLMRDAARLSLSLPDTTLFHEVFNPFVEPIPVRELDRALEGAGVRFLGHLESPATIVIGDATARALEADAQDLLGGSYHYALFGKGAHAPDLTAPHIAWQTRLRSESSVQYRVAGSAETVQILHAPTRATLDALADGPRPLLDAMPREQRDMTLRLFRDLWARRLVTPSRI